MIIFPILNEQLYLDEENSVPTNTNNPTQTASIYFKSIIYYIGAAIFLPPIVQVMGLLGFPLVLPMVAFKTYGGV